MQFNVKKNVQCSANVMLGMRFPRVLFFPFRIDVTSTVSRRQNTRATTSMRGCVADLVGSECILSKCPSVAMVE